MATLHGDAAARRACDQPADCGIGLAALGRLADANFYAIAQHASHGVLPRARYGLHP